MSSKKPTITKRMWGWLALALMSAYVAIKLIIDYVTLTIGLVVAWWRSLV
jgi:hypothetical protein